MRTGIIGAGNIGWRYDGGRWDGTRSVTHAACIDRYAETTLVAILEPEAAIRLEAAKALPETVAFHSSEADFFGEQLDVLCIASPTQLHDYHLRAAIDAGVSRVFLEKPVTGDYDAFSRLIEFADQSKNQPRICVNYFRRSLPQVKMLKKLCAESEPVCVDLIYSRGLAVNGVHLLDLIGFLFDLLSVPALQWVDPSDRANPSFGFKIGQTSIRFTGMDLPYHCIECRITFADGRVSLLDGGGVFLRERMQGNVDYPGFHHLGPQEPIIDKEQCAAWMRDGTYLSFCDLLEQDGEPSSTLQTAAFAEGLLHRVLQSCPV